MKSLNGGSLALGRVKNFVKLLKDSNYILGNEGVETKLPFFFDYEEVALRVVYFTSEP